MNPILNNSPVRVNLTKAQVEALIEQAVEQSFPNFVADTISFKVSTQTDNRHEVCGTTFEGVNVVLKPSSSSSNSSYWGR